MMFGARVLLSPKEGFSIFTFVDDYFCVRSNRVIINFRAEIRTQLSGALKILKSDNAKEYFSHALKSYLDSHGILHHSSCIDTPSQNGVAERKNRHLFNRQSLNVSDACSKIFLGDVVSPACFLINCMPSFFLKDEILHHNICFPFHPKYLVGPALFEM